MKRNMEERSENCSLMCLKIKRKAVLHIRLSDYIFSHTLALTSKHTTQKQEEKYLVRLAKIVSYKSIFGKEMLFCAGFPFS